MTAIVLDESRKLRRGSIILTGVFGMLTAFLLAVFPAMKEEAELIEEAYPEYVLVMLGFEEMHTIEGFAGGYIYPFVWILFGGVYFAYVGGGLIAGDIRSRKMDLTLANPVSRESVLAQKVAALWVPLLALNAGLLAVLFLGSRLIGEPLGFVDIAIVHLLSIPYLLVCAGIGVVFSVVFDRVGRAQVSALGLVFMLWLVDGISLMEPDYEWVGDLTPSRYYDPSAILLHEEYAFVDAAILLVAFLVLIGVATAIFTRRDI
ncbi:ABC-type transport system permease protein [Halalkaliarchaeum desulfuricum]|uniref:ABC-type transport system permease protein n=1 Tax=Halalkaliarchaeum desulfuricum TaxID=2055893 RepID=A0A343TK02_9EURY|nr:ABC transporter permease subunit [Halalkaliarchaeum desulfuricum]AUX09424.1 ABC-type transport system permease protein [Halalkaliarchaeum desulfuricum]